MNTELDAADALLNHGVKVRVTAPLLFRLFGKRTVNLVIKQPVLGSLYRVDQIILRSGLNTVDTEKDDGLYTAYAKPIAMIAAICWLDGPIAGRLFVWLVARWLLWHLTNAQLRTLYQVLVLLSNKEDFTYTIKLGSKMRMTIPNLSQPAQGS